MVLDPSGCDAEKVVRTRGTGPQLRAHIGGRTRRRRPKLWPYGWSILVIGLDSGKPEHLLIRVSLGFLYAFLSLAI